MVVVGELMGRRRPLDLADGFPSLDEPALLSVRDLKKGYGSTRAVDGMSFEVRDGETVGLLGRNGAGKSTTINCIVGLIEPESGSVSIGGATGRQHRQEHLGYASQETGVYNMLTVKENLEFLARIRGVDHAEESARDMLERFDLGSLGDRRAYALSGGQQRRLHLALAMVHNPLLLIVDEPTASLDVHARYEVLAVLQERRREGLATLLTTHLMHEAEELCDRLVVIDHGVALDQGTPSEIIGRHANPSVTVTVPEGFVADEALNQVGLQISFHGGNVQELVRRALGWIVDASVPVDDVTVQGATLEAAFLSLTASPPRADSPGDPVVAT